jgi:4-amino-4-deoxy-L-arabinose transferase-like glycosyltransferase
MVLPAQSPAPAVRDPSFLALAAACLLHLALLAPGLVPADLNLTYPFMDGDSWDWISNGLRLAGEDIRYSGRSPLLPLGIAALHRLGALSWLPVMLQGLFVAAVLALYSMAARLVPRRAAFAAALALLLNFSLAGLSLQVMADVPTACLLLLAVWSFERAGEDRRHYLASGLFAGLATLAQSVGALWVPAAGLTALVHRRRDLRSPWFWTSLAIPLVLPALWGLVQPPAVVGSGGFARAQWLLLSPHVGSVPFYLYALLSLLGIPGAVLLGIGTVFAIRRAMREPAIFLTLVLASALALFFVFLYDYNAKRFLVYGALVWGLLLAQALGRMRNRMAFGTAAVLLIAGSALPLPTSPADPSYVGLWPAPPVHLAVPMGAAANGSAVPDFGAARIERRSLTEGLLLSLPSLAWAARDRFRGFAPPDPTLFAGDHSAVYLYTDAGEEGGRHGAIPRLGNVLLKRVKFVPAALVEPFWDRLGATALGPLAGTALYRVRLPGRLETWIVAVAGGGRLRPVLEGLPDRPPAGGYRLRQARKTAEAIARFASGHDGFVAMVPAYRRPDPAQLYLPFLLETTELYVADPGQRREALGLLAGTPTLEERSFGAVTVKKTEYLGRPTSIVSFPLPRAAVRETAGPLPPPPPGRPGPRQSPPARGKGGRPGG